MGVVLRGGRIISGGDSWILLAKIVSAKNLEPQKETAFWWKDSNSYVLAKPLIFQGVNLGSFIALMDLDGLGDLLNQYKQEISNQGFQEISVFFRNPDFFTGENLSFGHYYTLRSQDLDLRFQFLNPFFISQYSLRMPDDSTGYIGSIVPENEVFKPVYQMGILSAIATFVLLSILVIALSFQTKNILKQLNQQVSKSRKLALGLLSMCTETDSVSRGMSTLVHEQSQSIEETATMVGEMAATSTDHAQRSRDTLDALGKTIEQTRVNAGLMAQVLKALESLCSSSAEVKELTHAIREISNRIDLVAINASIEAVRAGPKGQDFAVVVEEVEKLAQNAVEQSQKIDRQVQETLELSQSGHKAVEESQELFQQTLEQIKSSNRQLEEISDEARRQSERILQSAKTLINVDRKAARNRKVADQTAAHSRGLLDTMGELNSTLDEIRHLVEVVNNEEPS
jgi:ABC-type transporter Mla subunit MlaD